MHHIFPQKKGENYLDWEDRVTKFVKNLCKGIKNKDEKEKFEYLLHTNDWEIKRKRYIDKCCSNAQKSSNGNDYNLNFEDSDNHNVTTSTPCTPTQGIIKKSVTPVLNQRSIVTHQFNPPIYRQNEYKLTWNGVNLIQRAREKEPKTPFKTWLKTEECIQDNVLFTDGMEFNKSNSKKEQEKENIKLCDQIL